MNKLIPSLCVAVLALSALLSCTKTVYETKYVTIADSTQVSYSIQAFDVLPDNWASTNKINLQKAIDWASERGAALYVEPVKGGYPVESGIILKKNVSLIGVHGPTGRGTVSSDNEPTGSLFVITDDNKPFITVESATQIRGCQFYYPEQPFDKVAELKTYPPTIQVSHTSGAQGVTLSCLTFYGETFAMDFRADASHPCEQILFEHCYGYPLSGQFIAIDRCYDIPRILHCHVNPANQREFGKGYTKAVIDNVVKQKKFTYWIDHTDNAQCLDIFTFGNYGGIYLGAYTYGQLTNFNFDCVCIGAFKDGDRPFNRVWEVAQGSVIANVSPNGNVSEIHPFFVTGQGHLSLSNVDCFSGNNSALTNQGQSYDFITVAGTKYLNVTGVNCRMRNYQAAVPITVTNPLAQVSFINCADKDGDLFNWSFGLK